MITYILKEHGMEKEGKWKKERGGEGVREREKEELMNLTLITQFKKSIISNFKVFS